MWKKYSTKLGFSTRLDFETNIENIYHDKSIEIGCILINQLHFYKRRLSLDECNIDFSRYIVSGKKIGPEDCKKIENTAGE